MLFLIRRSFKFSANNNIFLAMAAMLNLQSTRNTQTSTGLPCEHSCQFGFTEFSGFPEKDLKFRDEERQ